VPACHRAPTRVQTLLRAIVTPLSILVAETEPDICAQLIAQQMGSYPDVHLFGGRRFGLAEIGALMEAKGDKPDAVIIVGHAPEVDRGCMSLASAHQQLVVVRVASVGDLVRFDARNINLQMMIEAARRLAESPASPAEHRIARFDLSAGNGRVVLPDGTGQGVTTTIDGERPIVCAIVKWLHKLLTCAVIRQHDQEVTRAAESLHGLAVSPTALERALDSPGPCEVPDPHSDVEALERALFAELDAGDAWKEPFAALYRSLHLTPLEMKAFLIAFAPEFDLRYQRSFGLLLDELGRRNPTLPLIASLLGEPASVRRQLAATNRLARWRLFESSAAHALAGDEPVRVDAALVGWLFGNALALRDDARLAQALTLEPWPGARLLCTERDNALAAEISKTLGGNGRPYWMVFVGEDLAAWRALVERAVDHHKLNVARISLARLETLDRYDLADAIERLTRLIRLTTTVPVVDFVHSDSPARTDEMLRRVATAVVRGRAHAALITAEPERCLPLLGPVDARLQDRPALDTASRAVILEAAAKELGAPLSPSQATGLSAAFPLAVDGIFCAVRLASATKRHDDSPGQVHRKLRAACRRAASQNVSRLVQRLEPKFDLGAVKLPEDRLRQLREILANVQFSTKVLDDWRFANLLPYGRGVTALFHGPSGTGKTMAAQAIAKELCVEVFLVDLSRVVSKYIGDTEKNLDIVFGETQRSGGLLLLDEAEALLGKRSEVKDSHDRYANMEIAFLLQRMEMFSGLAILTTNLRQNLDQAFLRRLRFIVDFPKPDAVAREKIWQLCLPEGTHALSAEEFRVLGRKVDLTGGNIRQISVRAAFLAAADKDNKSQKIQMRHVIEAARAELAKLGLPTPLLDVPTQPAAKAPADKVA
jgi:hypothetical protein